MNDRDLLDGRRTTLIAVVAGSLGNNPHIDAFAARLIGADRAGDLLPGFAFARPPDADAMRYEGFPRVASVGFGLGSGNLSASDAGDLFLAGVRRLQARQGQLLQAMSSDDLALLGLCEGVACVRAAGGATTQEVGDWLVGLVDRAPARGDWLARARSLAGDMVDGRGRLRASPAAKDTDSRALEYALRGTWPGLFTVADDADDGGRAELLAALLAEPAPRPGDLARAVVWLRAMDILVAHAARRLAPSIPDTVVILQDVQHSLKRWRSDERTRRRGVRPGTWLIDDEYDVQTLLWAVLYPLFRSDLVDEEYLPSWGFTEPRLDLGIVSLGVIIEAKIARNSGDFNKIEAEIHADLGLYFKDPSRFRRMIVFIYDDCDRHVPEAIDGLKNALMKRDRIEGVVVVRRPSVMPGRGARSVPPAT